MSGIRVVSFDVWATLVRGNPAYKGRRVDRAAAALGADRVATGRALDATDDDLDEATLRTGRQYGCADRLRHTAGALGVAPPPEATLAAVEADLADAFRRHPPTPTEPDVLTTLARLRAAGLALAVTSNTGFVSGGQVRRALVELGLRFDHHVFSDEVGHAKPSPLIFDRLTAAARCRPDEVVHVGDNRRADVLGATGAGLRALWYRPGRPTTDEVVGRLADLPDHPLLTRAAHRAP